MEKFWKRWRRDPSLASSQSDPNNTTTIHEAARQGNDALVKSLLKHTSVQAKSSDLRTPLSLAAEWGRTSTVKLLLKRGAKVSEQDGDGRTPLHWAAEFGHVDVVRLLTKNGASASVPSARGDTPASLAHACDQHAVLKLMGTSATPPVSRVKQDSMQRRPMTRNTELEEKWLAERHHDRFA